MSNYQAPYQGKQTVVDAGAGVPHGYKQVNTYTGSQNGWLIKTVHPSKVEATKAQQLKALGNMIADRVIACTNPDMRIHATKAILTKALIHKGELQ